VKVEAYAVNMGDNNEKIVEMHVSTVVNNEGTSTK